MRLVNFDNHAPAVGNAEPPAAHAVEVTHPSLTARPILRTVRTEWR